MLEDSELPQNLTTGHTMIDAQHSELLFLVKNLKQCVKTQDIVETKKLYVSFLDHIINHFTYEELLMQKIQLPLSEYSHHLAEHRKLQQMYFFAYKALIADELQVQDVLTIFEEHFLTHLQNDDFRLVDFIQKNNKEIDVRLLTLLHQQKTSSE